AYGKGGSLVVPGRLAVADDDQEVDGVSLDEPVEAGREIRTATTVQLQLRCAEHFSHIVHDGVTTGHDHFGGVPKLTRQPSELRDRPRQLRVLHRGRRVDEKAGSGTRLVE